MRGRLIKFVNPTQADTQTPAPEANNTSAPTQAPTPPAPEVTTPAPLSDSERQERLDIINRLIRTR
ncbi:hypothetical protein, partial [Helicobacter suis]